MLIMNREKQRMTNGRERPNKDKIRTHAEKHTQKYLGIFEADTIIQNRDERKTKKKYIGEQESYLKPNYKAVTLQKG